MADSKSRPFLEPRLATVEYLTQVDHKATAYVCENYTCKKPVTSPSELQDLLINK